MNAIEVNDVCFSYDNNRLILNNVSFNIKPATVTSILGPNGSGKTTMLKVILGLLRPKCGTVYVCGNNLDSLDLKSRAKLLSYVPQKHKAAFAYKVLDVVAMGKLPYSGVFCITSKKDYEEAEEMLAKMGLEYLKDREFNALSGGEQQLAMICRALLQNASVLVLDEPVTGLDYGNQLFLLKKLRELSKCGITCIMTTHFPEHALWTSDNSIFFKNGSVLVSGKSSDVITSDNLFKIYNAQIGVINAELNGKSIAACVPLI